MRRSVLAALTLALAACAEPPAEREAPPASAAAPVEPVEATDTASLDEAAVGGTFYVPVYSHIYFRDARRSVDLAATLSVRNADARTPITVRSVRYHASDGTLVRSYLTGPVLLAPLASAAYVVEEYDTRGGVGASFLVDWTAAAPAVDPVVEAVMISAASAQGISFVSVGRPVARR